jgi:DNA-directed RNA polymerase subunit alpha
MVIEELNLSVRGYNCLKRSGLGTIEGVVGRTESELLALRNFGGYSYDELLSKLQSEALLAPGDSSRLGSTMTPPPHGSRGDEEIG